MDLILKGGRIIDPSQHLDAVADISFAGGKVAAIGPDLAADAGTEVLNVSGLILTPGLIDLHTHVYWGGTSLGVDAEEFCRLSGVTTCIDTGSAGPGNFAGFRKHVIEPSAVRILAYLHVSFADHHGFRVREDAGERYVQISEDAHRARFDDVLAKARKVARPGAAGVDARGDAAQAAEFLRVDAERRTAPIDVGMQVDEAGRDDEARHVAHFGPGVRRKTGADRRDLAAGEADVRHRIEMLRRIDDPTALEDEIDGHCSSRCSGLGRGPRVRAD